MNDAELKVAALRNSLHSVDVSQKINCFARRSVSTKKMNSPRKLSHRVTFVKGKMPYLSTIEKKYDSSRIGLLNSIHSGILNGMKTSYRSSKPLCGWVELQWMGKKYNNCCGTFSPIPIYRGTVHPIFAIFHGTHGNQNRLPTKIPIIGLLSYANEAWDNG